MPERQAKTLMQSRQSPAFYFVNRHIIKQTEAVGGNITAKCSQKDKHTVMEPIGL